MLWWYGKKKCGFNPGKSTTRYTIRKRTPCSTMSMSSGERISLKSTIPRISPSPRYFVFIYFFFLIRTVYARSTLLFEKNKKKLLVNVIENDYAEKNIYNIILK